MSLPLEVLEAELLQLSKQDRIRVLDRVVASLDADSARDAAWDAVARERQRQSAVHPELLLPLDQVLAALHVGLR